MAWISILVTGRSFFEKVWVPGLWFKSAVVLLLSIQLSLWRMGLTLFPAASLEFPVVWSTALILDGHLLLPDISLGSEYTSRLESGKIKDIDRACTDTFLRLSVFSVELFNVRADNPVFRYLSDDLGRLELLTESFNFPAPLVRVTARTFKFSFATFVSLWSVSAAYGAFSMSGKSAKLCCGGVDPWSWPARLSVPGLVLAWWCTVICRLGSKGSTTICSVPFISARQNGHPPPPPSESWKQKKIINFHGF